MKKTIDYLDRGHEGSPEMTNTSVSFPKSLLSKISAIAKYENRSRSGQIVHMLRECLVEYEAKKNKPSAHEGSPSEEQP